jgi:hypothetical protein
VALLMNLVNAYGFLTSSTPEPRHTIFYAVVAAIMLLIVPQVDWRPSTIPHPLSRTWTMTRATRAGIPAADQDSERPRRIEHRRDLAEVTDAMVELARAFVSE